MHTYPLIPVPADLHDRLVVAAEFLNNGGCSSFDFGEWEKPVSVEEIVKVALERYLEDEVYWVV